MASNAPKRQLSLRFNEREPETQESQEKAQEPVEESPSTPPAIWQNSAWHDLICHLDERGIEYIPHDEKTWVSLTWPGNVANYALFAQVVEWANSFQVLGYAPILIPEGCRSAITEAVTRANSGLLSGKFELDLETGKLRFQGCQILTDTGLDGDLVDRFISSTVRLLDRYLPAFLSVIYGNELPKDAIRHVEGVPCSEQPEHDNE